VIKIQGLLTSKIETRTKGQETYYYSFFKLENQEQETPVIFKVKPALTKGCEVELTGNWAKSNGDRPSFTCQAYQLLKDPPPPTLKSLQKEIQLLINPSLSKKQEWAQTVDFFFRKLEELKKIEQLSKLSSSYLKAYFLTENARYANYQAEHLPQANFSLESYLKRIASELEIVQRQMLAAGWKETKHD
jgi:hypothetical protein